ncbi:MAG: UDP-N-acetylmuramyl-tripeptide synthetase/UDP-N-acetylmuramoyl-tripeptide--D-alanyl-D-alanine [Desulfobulbaceae bacterium]|nr:MAG: UDP-N-acetylmuramyl-tripeptide synthetase/UDP-N-acetylmuramoyl-tripeptide--D-alanyl-D-alanine [Desulfobulbaceae bacterium]
MDCTRAEQQSAQRGDSREYALADLLHSVTYSVLGKKLPDTVMISGVVVDSRKVEAGSLFVALTGSRVDGHAFLDQVMAIGRPSSIPGASDAEPSLACGCVALIVEEGKVDPERFADCSQCVIMVADSHLAYARIAANFYGNPAQGLTLVGITGTNGKTTVSYLLESILRQKGLAVGVIGTVSYRYRAAQGQDVEMPAPFTTPEPLLLQGLLRQMADAGVTHVIMEVSSHALVQRRLGDLRFDVVAFTNLSRDHLDYHLDMDDYFAAKSLLFGVYLKQDGAAIITRPEIVDPEETKRVAQLVSLAQGQRAQVLQCGRVGVSDIYPLNIHSGLDATTLTMRLPSGLLFFETPLVGEFNVANLQTAVGLGLALGLEAQSISSFMKNATGAPGRLQRVKPAVAELHFRPAVFVDYAHTPDALEKVLTTLARLSHRKLICVFGCGGDRDKGKRAIMGEIAGRNCDVVLVTDDNPRSESPVEIVAQIVSGVSASDLPERDPSWLMISKAEEKGFFVLHDRAAAITAAIDAAVNEDIVLVAGKGHEQYQLGQDGKRFFDDSLEVKKGLTTWRLEGLMLATGGELKTELPGLTERVALRAVVTDSRKVGVGDIFVALVGEQFDGHDFLEQVAAAGAGCLVVHRNTPRHKLPALPCLLVDDTLQALGNLAAYRRQIVKSVNSPQIIDVSKSCEPGTQQAMAEPVAVASWTGEERRQKGWPLVVGITGSCGKTTVKEMVAAIFEQHWPSADVDVQFPSNQVLKTRGNFNNLIGLPLSLLPLGPGHRAAVLEMGMNRPGEIARLARIADPDIACIVNVHAAHLEGLHSLEGVARAKEELFAASGKNTVLVVNLDDPLVRACAAKYQQKKVYYGTTVEGGQPASQVWATDIQKIGGGLQDFFLHVAGKTIMVSLYIPGDHNVSNAVAAAAIAYAAGIDITEIAAGLGVFRSADKRMQIVKGKGGLNILNDTYNANPASMRAGLATLGQQEGVRKLAIIGDMLELGPTSAEAHREVGKFAAALAIDYLALVGNFATEIAAGATMAGLENERVRIFAEKKDVAPWVEELVDTGRLQADDWLLVKGSRGMRLEEVVALLIEQKRD